MSARILNAKAEYKSRKWKAGEANFYGSDVTEVLDNCDGDAVKAIITALEAGFMIGYRKGVKDSRCKMQNPKHEIAGQSGNSYPASKV